MVAVGGNALAREGEPATHEHQLANAACMADMIAGIVAGGRHVVVTHGNGPQVGNLALQQEEGARLVPPQPLSVLGAMTQGQIGHILDVAIRNRPSTPPLDPVALVTHVLVDARDPAFEHPTKPIGPFLSADAAHAMAEERGWQVVEDAGRGYRRVVPSPQPLEIVEADAIKGLADGGFVVIAAGGGGIPVVRTEGGLAGTEAVIDKDLAAERLASAVGARTLAMVTAVDRVLLRYGTPEAVALEEITRDEAQAYLEAGEFPAGSMGPKVTAAIRFLDAGGELAVITSAEHLLEALDGRHGTRIVSGRGRP